MRVLVTGATGFLGFGIARELHGRGSEVVAMARRESDTGRLRAEGIGTATADILDPASLQAAFRGVEAVVHCAALSSDWGPYREFHRLNVDGTRNVLAACRAGGVGRLVHVSTVDIFGHGTRRPIDEDAPLARPIGPYSRTKAQAERLVREAMAAAAGAHPRPAVTIVYPSWVYGEGDRRFFPELIRALRDRSALFFGGGGGNRVELIYIGNLASAVAHLLDRPDSAGRGYILSDPDAVSLRALLNGVAARLGLPVVRRDIPFPVAYAAAWLLEIACRLGGRGPARPLITRQAVAMLGRDIRYDTSRLRATGWRPPFTCEEALERTLRPWLAGAGLPAT